MKTLMNSLKALSFLFACLLSNSIYSAPCGAPWGINASATLASCTYTFTPILPTPPPTGLTFDWEIRSSGSASANCDSYRNQHSLTYQFCFYGLHDAIPLYALDFLFQVKIPSNTSTSSIFFLHHRDDYGLSKNLAGALVFFGLLPFITKL
ncbi:MAG: hypothetical protein IPQ02_15895 [Saprospiraceae bacterium]|nr:hypothetical protein [Candidatus Defluviibacterium haderslevense]